MARPRAFGREQVLTAATDLFLAAGLSRDQRRRAVPGNGRSSLYNTFGSKGALFAECLARHLDATVQAIVTGEVLPCPRPPVPAAVCVLAAGVFAVFLAGNVLAALATTYSAMVVARVISGVASQAFFGIAISLCGQLVEERVRGRTARCSALCSGCRWRPSRADITAGGRHLGQSPC